jgi:hypothetical protein
MVLGERNQRATPFASNDALFGAAVARGLRKS